MPLILWYKSFNLHQMSASLHVQEAPALGDLSSMQGPTLQLGTWPDLSKQSGGDAHGSQARQLAGDAGVFRQAAQTCVAVRLEKTQRVQQPDCFMHGISRGMRTAER